MDTVIVWFIANTFEIYLTATFFTKKILFITLQSEVAKFMENRR